MPDHRGLKLDNDSRVAVIGGSPAGSRFAYQLTPGDRLAIFGRCTAGCFLPCTSSGLGEDQIRSLGSANVTICFLMRLFGIMRGPNPNPNRM